MRFWSLPEAWGTSYWRGELQPRRGCWGSAVVSQSGFWPRGAELGGFWVCTHTPAQGDWLRVCGVLLGPSPLPIAPCAQSRPEPRGSGDGRRTPGRPCRPAAGCGAMGRGLLSRVGRAKAGFLRGPVNICGALTQRGGWAGPASWLGCCSRGFSLGPRRL